MTNSGWFVVEEESYQRALGQLGGMAKVGRALAPILYALYRNPEGFDRVLGYQNLYLARTKLSIRGLDLIPAMRVWFRTQPELRRVRLLWVEMAQPEDMEIVDTLWDDDSDAPV